MIENFDFEIASTFVHMIKILLNYSADGEEVSPFGDLKNNDNPNRVQEKELDGGSIMHKSEIAHFTKDNFLVHHSNPLKIIILILTLLV